MLLAPPLLSLAVLGFAQLGSAAIPPENVINGKGQLKTNRVQ